MDSTNTITTINQLTPDILLHITEYLDIKSVFALSMSCKSLSSLISDERVLRRLVKSDYKITYKDPSLTWRQLYQQLQRHQISLCPHLGAIPNELAKSKQQLSANHLQQPSPCDSCQINKVTFLSLHPASDKQVCRSCASKEEGPSAVQYNLDTQSLYCFKCSRQVGGDGTNENEKYKASITLDQLKVEPVSSTPSDVTKGTTTDTTIAITNHHDQQEQENLDQRRKTEQMLYVQELRQEDMSLKHYLVEKSWGRAWMLFRTREGSPAPGQITNNKLTRSNGTLDPNIRIPIDKYRPSPETHADIVSQNLWSYLEKTYGVQGKAYSEDDLQGPEYARLRMCVDDFKRSIELYP
ncbi:uncharacterized protein BX664DRAFT_325413 [Halteromyces radiatus]|uniref:uncharacterized protein n=1 Tax=Halteromyces radiatus TaxID=101107 RepID=UPI00221FD8A6|nr:uncharacterized protein BX664DRAFT_325413 [Halteromyces radiatus]KAI8097018.1 hypothetical protein BX664DRAFT_325413 [Halteromyces radiatus]